MRSSVKSEKKTSKTTNKKSVSAKKKKITDVKSPLRDTISETISFVIKGKLTPIKPILIQNKADLIDKTKKRPPKGGKVIKKRKCNINKKPSEPGVKTPRKENPKARTKVKIKAVKKAAVHSILKRAADKIAIDVMSRTPKESAKNKTKTENEIKNIKQKPVAKKAKKVVAVKEKQTKVAIKKPKLQKKSECKKANEVSLQNDTNNEDELKKQQTIDKLMKQVNKEIKSKNISRKKPAKSKETEKPKKLKLLGNSTQPHSTDNQISKQVPAMEKIVEDNNMDKIQQIKSETPASPTDELSDEIPLKQLSQRREFCFPLGKIKTEPISDGEQTPPTPAKKKVLKKLRTKPKMMIMKKRIMPSKHKATMDERCRTKLFGFWNGPKRHRVASLNALAKVHCLYENESRGNMLDIIDESSKLAYTPKKDSKVAKVKKESNADDDTTDDVPSPLPTRTLRSVPGLRAVGKLWDMHDTTSSSDDSAGYDSGNEQPIEVVKKEKPTKTQADTEEKPCEKRKQQKKSPRKRAEVMMDLKDMVVSKRMASLNASAILAASYSMEKRPTRTSKDDDDSSSYDSGSSDEYFAASDNDIKDEDDDAKKEEDRKLIEVHTTPNKKVAVILNQDTDVTITGVYVNSTTRSTHHEGYCSIAGMQYRISATSHTQTAATAVATETLLQSSASSAPDNSNSDSLPSSKSYTPLDALSNMQPPPGPGVQHAHPVIHGQAPMGPPQHVLPMPAHQVSPGLRHGCSSAFSSPHSTPSYQLPPGHHPPVQGETGYVHAGYYQPAGPLISVPHAHGQPPPPPPPLTKSVPLSEVSPTSTTPSVTSHEPPPPPSSNGDSSDSEVIITSVTTAKEALPPPHSSHAHPSYRYSQYPPAHPGYSHSYPQPYHYSAQPPPNPSYSHHDLCYSPSPYGYKYQPYRRYLTSVPYYGPNPQEIYPLPPAGPTQPSQQVVTTTPVSATATSYPTAPGGPPPPPTLMETYPSPQPTLVETYQPPPPHYYPPGYVPAPSCYTHSPSRAIPYISTAYQSCPCPMQSCPKNVLTGPLTGDSKRSIQTISKDSMPLPPVALALPLEPVSATGPPSPARGSAGMAPPPSPAGATYQPHPPVAKHDSHLLPAEAVFKTEKKRKARVGKAMVRNNIVANMHQQHTMLLMCNPSQNYISTVKREIESPKDKEVVLIEKKEICSSDEEAKPITEDLNSCARQEESHVAESPQEIVQPKEEVISEEKANEGDNSLLLKDVEEKEELQPVVNTVAENVKVKNMKRKMSQSKEKETAAEISRPPRKKQKLGSYKYFIKRDANTFRIHSGRRRLIEEPSQPARTRRTKIKMKKPTTRRKLVLKKEDSSKSKPLTVNNYNNSKVSKSKCLVESVDKQIKKVNKKSTVNLKNSKSASAVLDSLIAKNNVDRTIDRVITEVCVRTSKELSVLKLAEKCAKTSKDLIPNNKSTNNRIVLNKAKSECKKTGASRRKSKCKEPEVPQTITKIPRRSLHLPRWSNGWRWEGKPYEAKVFINSDETTVLRTCYPAMRHSEGDIILPRDCVLLAGPRKNDLPYVAKIASLWENPEDGEMMMSLLWFYRPEHTEQGRLPADQTDEVFASRHKDSNSVACIDDKCYVLTFNEYCRYRKRYKRNEEGIETALSCIPNLDRYARNHRQPPETQISPDMVFFCRRVYDFRQKRMMKNPT